MEMTGLSKVSLKPPNFSLCSGIRQRRTGSLLRCRTRSTVVKSMSTNNTAAIPIMVSESLIFSLFNLVIVVNW
uniref:Uncharacterized protein n=1 Tax=Rhizophora mucronata TaxID=61149 RepID=A0A2P2JWS5_RHIMU